MRMFIKYMVDEQGCALPENVAGKMIYIPNGGVCKFKVQMVGAGGDDATSAASSSTAPRVIKVECSQIEANQSRDHLLGLGPIKLRPS